MGLLDLVVGSQTKILRPSGGCHSCPLKRVDFVPPTLNGPGGVLWLGETPGETDVGAQEVLVGKSGQKLRADAARAGVPTPWSFSNTVHCMPPDNGAPSPKAVQCCLAQFTLPEIRGYPMVVLVGNLPLQALFPGARADHFRGNVAWHPDFPGQRFYAIFHPAYILKRPDLQDQFDRQLERLSRILRGEAEPEWRIVRGEEALRATRDILQSPLLSLDLECDRLESWVVGKGGIKSVAFTADGKTVVAVHKDEPQFAPVMRAVANYVALPGKSAVGSNIAFDLEWIEREYGVRAACQLIHELQVVWYYAGQYQQASLKELVSRELDGYRYLVHEPHHCKDVELLLRYGAEDVVRPLELLRRGLAKLQPRTRDLSVRVLGPVSLILRRMTATGLYLRQDYWREKIAEYHARHKAIVQKWKAEDPEFIPSENESGDGLIHYLYTVRGLPVLSETASGQPSTDQSVLKQLVRDGYGVAQHVLDMREVDTVQSTFLTAYEKWVGADSRIRTNYTLTFTDSGRTSSRKPNVQNIPKKNEIRDLFGVAPGHIMLESDLSQIEFRIMVCLAKDETGIAGYLRGEDAHTMTARAITGNPTPTKAQRSGAKPVNFGFLYGAKAPTVQRLVADDYGVIWTDWEAEGFRNTFMGTYQRIPEFHESSRQKLVANRGWFESATGHVYHYDGWDFKDQGKRDHIFRAALNSEGQGPAAQICFYLMVLARRLLDARGFQTVQFVNTVHDSILTEIPNPLWLGDVVATMNEAAALAHNWVRHWFVVPLILEHSSGTSWGSLKGIE